MHISARSRRVAGVLTALGAVLVTFASTGTAELAAAWTACRQPLAAPRFGSPAQVAGGK